MTLLRCGGVFTVDPDIPADHRGRKTCICGLTGRPGDPHHDVPAAPDQAEHLRRVGDDSLEEERTEAQ